MFIFWWQGRGYQTIWILFFTLSLFGVAATIGKAYIPDSPWYWGLSLFTAALINWKRGSTLNAKRLALRQSVTLRSRLFYNARHRFMSIPMESFSIILAAAGILIALWPIIHR
ncbi:hypothetical protein [Sandarakinorhabdus oryzae]|uniref:hypothetical protein n=1 Tax=Sandarakinorhabdus oryzae TaxID=2675220 RepID=UPI0012E1F1A7|nr:hypothetical protein [Sandarakinorhabdus oryzae]